MDIIKENYNKNISNQRYVEPRYNNFEFIHYYNEFYSSTESSKTNPFESLRDIYHRVIVIKSINGNYLVIATNIEEVFSRGINHSWDSVFLNLQSIYKYLKSNNTQFTEKENTKYNSHSVKIDENLNPSWKNFSINDNIRFLDSTLYEIMNVYSYSSGYNAEKRINYINRNFKDSEIIEYIKLNYEDKKSAFLFLKNNIFDGNLVDLYELDRMIIEYIDDNQIKIKLNKEDIEFLNNEFLTSAIINEDLFRYKDFFNQNYLSFIKTKNAIKHNKKFLIPHIIKHKIDGF